MRFFQRKKNLKKRWKLRISNPSDDHSDTEIKLCTSSIFWFLIEFRWFWNDLIQILIRFWCVLRMCFAFLPFIFQDFYRKSTISTNFPMLQSRIFEKYAAFAALFMHLFDFFVFFTFWPRFGALLIVLWNFVDVFSMIFSVLNEFRWFWNDLIKILTRFWCVLRNCFAFLPLPHPGACGTCVCWAALCPTALQVPAEISCICAKQSSGCIGGY